MLLFLLLCIASILAGVGILTAFRVPVPPAQRWLLGPAACLVAWSIVLGVAISLGLTVRSLALPFWAATAVAALYGAWQARRSFSHDVGWLLALAIALPIALLPFDFSHDLSDFIGGPTADGWSYVARGQELWELPNSTEGHLAPLHEYASHMRQTRFIAPALLGVLSPLTREPGDTQAAAGHFLALTLFFFGASCLAVASTARMSSRWLAAFCALAVISRWVLGAIQVHNYDNLLALSSLPMTMALVAGLESPTWRATLVLGLFMAAAVYTYPEMAIFTIIGAALSSMRRAHSSARPGAWIGMTVAGMALALILLIPTWRDLIWFIATQFHNATVAIGGRPGEGTFPELLPIRNWSTAIWGLTGAATRRFGSAWSIGAGVVGLFCWVLAGIGYVKLVQQRLWDVAVVGMLLMVGAVVLIVNQQYTYGAYKFVLVGWWVAALSVTVGVRTLVELTRGEQRPSRRRVWKVAAGASLAIVPIALFGSVAGRVVVFQRQLSVTSIRPYRAVLDVERVVGRAPLILTVSDPIANQWAVYFLRSHPLRLLGYRSRMAYPHVVPFMDKSTGPELHTIQYVLGDPLSTSQSEVLWQQGPYALWRIPATGTAFLGRVVNPNGSEQLEGQSFYWIGQGDTELEVYATTAGDAIFSGRFILGPSLPDRLDRRLILGEAGTGERPVTIGQNGDQSFSFPVHAGQNLIYVRPLDRPSVTLTGDPRPLLLGVQGLKVWLRPAVPPARLP